MSEYYKTDEVAKRLGITARQVSRLAQQGKIPFVRRGRLIRIPVAAWEEWMRRQTQEALAAVSGGAPHA